jgi:hypothetical protein
MLRKVTVISAVILGLVGCASPKSFVDPSFPKVGYGELKKQSSPLHLKLNVEFQRNGEHMSKVDKTLQTNAETVLNKTGLVIPSADGTDGEIKVVVNNIADLAKARALGFRTGLTFGLAGTTVTDAYEMSITITAKGKTISRSGIKHELHTAIGKTTLPADLEIMTPDAAFEKVFEQMLLRALQDMQKTGELSLLGFPEVSIAYSPYIQRELSVIALLSPSVSFD